MPDLKKLLSRFDKKERNILEILIEKIISLNWKNLDVKKLKGYQNIFRVKRSKLRIIYKLTEQKEIQIISIERRSENTYKF
ncbi:MAG: hypothetical protein AAB621_03085 [Patescibacteria group bacterium]